jgi:hypothetical protein
MGMKASPYILTVLGVSLVGFTAASAQADCDGPRWRDGLQISIGFDTVPAASASIDHDGDGVPSLFVAGSGGASGVAFEGLVRLVDGRWQSFGPSFKGSVSKFERFDLDGDGTPSFILLGSMQLETGGPRYSVLEWTGAAWAGRSPERHIGDAVVLDDDGDGVASLFASVRGGGSQTAPLVRWTAAGWTALSPQNTILNAAPQSTETIVLAAFDSDGDGSKELFAPVNVSAAGASIASGMARWDGVAWSALAGGTQPSVLAQGVLSMCAADTDGDGAPELVVAGLSGFSPSAGSQVVAYDGTAWSALGGSFLRVESAFTATAAVQRIAAVDLGGKTPALFATGFFNAIDGTTVANIARWNGSAWSDVGGGFPGPNLGADRALHGHDFDGDGVDELVGAGSFVRAGNALANRLAAYDGSSWSAIGLASPTVGLNEGASSSVLFDHDGDGRASLLVGGFFDVAGAEQAPSLAAFDGATWEAIPNPWAGGVEALLVADLDGDGVQSLYAAGDTGVAFDASGNVRTIAVYTPGKGGGSWTQFGGSFNAQVSALAAVDHDLDGQPSLFAGGFFSRLDAVTVSKLVRWTGSGWTGLNPGSGQAVGSIVSFDDDGNGTPSMIVSMWNADPGSFLPRVRKFNGTAWTSVGAISQGHAFRLQVIDHDGDGVASLFTFGQFMTGGGVAWVQRLQSGAWTPFGPASDTAYTQAGGSLVRFDSDGDGVASLYLVNDDPFFFRAASIQRLDGASWVSVASDLGAIPATALVADLEDDGVQSLHLVGRMGARAGGPGSNIAIIDACTASCPADIDQSGEVDSADLGAVLSAWGPCGAACLADLDRDGFVDSVDLGILLSAWGACP